MLPIPPNKIKSPPPIPSNPLINLNKKLINHKKKYAAKKPIIENIAGEILNSIMLSSRASEKKIFPVKPITGINIFIAIGRKKYLRSKKNKI